MIDAGTYRAKAVSAALGNTSTGKEQLGIEFELMDVDGVAGPHITYYGYFTDAALEFTVKALRACGWKGTDLTDLAGLTDNEVSLVIAHEEYEGKVTAKVQWVNAPGGLAMKSQLDPDAAKMKGRIAALGTTSARQIREPKPPKSQNSEPPPHGDADLPGWAREG